MSRQPGSVNNIPPDPRDVVPAKLKDLQDQIDELRTARTLQAAEIGAGGLTIDQGGALKVIDVNTGHTVLYVGDTGFADGSGRRQGAVLMYRADDGSAAMQLADGGTTPGHTYRQAFAWADRAANIVFADDDTGNGVARPYIPLGTFVDITAPTSTTNSATYVGLQWADCYQQHPKLTASLLIQTGAGTTGDVRITVGGVQVGATVAVGAASFGQFTIAPATWPGGTWAYTNRVTLQLEARVTGGAGTIGVRGLGLWGVQA